MANPWDNDEIVNEAPQTSSDAPWQHDEVAETPWQNDKAIDYKAAKNEIRNTINRGGDVAAVNAVAVKYGLDPASINGIEGAVKWRARHGNYTGTISLAGEDKPQPTRAPHEDKGVVDAAVTGALDSASFGFGDEIGAGLSAGANSLGNLVGLGDGQSFGDRYEQDVAANREQLANAQDDHSVAFGGGQIAGGLATLPIGGGEATLGRLALRAAAEGGAYGFGSGQGGLGNRAVNAAESAGMGVAATGALKGLGRVASPVLTPAVRALLDAGVRLTPGQLLASKGGLVGAVGQKGEEALANFSLVGSMVNSAQRRSAEDFDRSVVEKIVKPVAMGADIPRDIRPEELATRARTVIDHVGQVGQGNHVMAALHSRADHDLGALEDLYSFRRGQATPEDILDHVASKPNVKLGGDVYDYALNSKDAFGDASVKQGKGYVGDLVKLGLRGLGTYGASFAGLPATVAGNLAIAGAYSRPGQAALRSAMTGRQGANWVAARNGLNNIARNSRVAGAVAQDYSPDLQYIPNIDEEQR